MGEVTPTHRRCPLSRPPLSLLPLQWQRLSPRLLLEGTLNHRAALIQCPLRSQGHGAAKWKEDK